MSYWVRATYQIPFGHRGVSFGIDGGVCPEPIELSAGLRHRAQRTGMPSLFDGPNGTEQGTAFAVLQEREESG